MIYVMSDVHGEYGKYIQMLEKIHFSQNDTLFVLGDVVDRGAEPVRILRDMMLRENVYLIKGNHEGMACYVLDKLNVEITSANAESHLDALLMQAILEWQQNGGDVTMKQFALLPGQERQDLMQYMADAPLYDMVDVGENTYLLVHAGLGHFEKGKRLSQYTFEELSYMRPDYERQYFQDPSIFIISGHIPTRAVTGKDEIYHSHHNILIDCGAAYGGRLACLCLDTMEEYYV